jgi:hypothetical protein
MSTILSAYALIVFKIFFCIVMEKLKNKDLACFYVGCSIFAYIFFRFKAKRSEQRSVSHAFRLFASKFLLPFFRNIRLFSHKIFFRFRFV